MTDSATILVMGPSESVVRAAVDAVASAPGVPRGVTVKGVLADGPSVTFVEAVAGARVSAMPASPSVGAGPSMSAWAPPSAGGSMFAGDGSWGSSGGAAWGPVGGDSWGDVEASADAPGEVPVPEIRPPAPSPVFPEEPTPRPRRASGSTDMSGVPPAIVDAARTLRRFVDTEVPEGVLLRVMRARVKTGGDVQTGLKDLCTLVKEYGEDGPIMDTYSMVAYALPRVREKQAHKVLTAIFDVE